MSIDVVVLTKNSERILEKCLNSIYQNVPVNNVIVVDGFSTDRTLEILERFKAENQNIKIISDKGTRATARQKGIQNVDTEWFMFVDSDVVLCQDWFKRATKHINDVDDVGAVFGLNLDAPNVKSPIMLRMLMHTAKEAFKFRGGTHDILILRDLVKDIKIPEDLCVYEDKYIIDWIRKKGYKVIMGDDLYCMHYIPPTDWCLKKSIYLASSEIKYGLFRFHFFKNILYYPFFVFHWFVQNMKKNSIL